MTREYAIELLENFKNRQIERDKLELNINGGYKIGGIHYYQLSKAINLILEDNTRLDKENQKLFEENLFKDKVIDEMIDYIDGMGDTPDILCEDYNEECHKYVKQYFYKKVEEQE